MVSTSNSEARNDEIQNFQREDFYFVGIRNTIFRKNPPSLVSGYGKRSINLNKVVANFEKHIFLSQTELTRTGIISNCYNEMFFYFVGITF
jgi:hypothetical protein